MPQRPGASDERGELSESAAVAVLVGITLLMTLSAGFYVLAVDTGDTTLTANFSYDYDSNGDALVVRYTEGDSFNASAIVLESGRTEYRWAEIAGLGPNATLEPGAAIQLSANGRWGRPVTDATTLRIHHVDDGNRTQLSNWSSK